MWCWLLALAGMVGSAVAIYYVSRLGAALAIERDRQRHLAIVNAARRRAGKPPLTLEDLPPEPPPERDPLLERLLGIDSEAGRGFEVLPATSGRSEAGEAASAGPRSSLPAGGSSSTVAALPVVPVEGVGRGGGRSGVGQRPGAGVRPVVVLLERSGRELDRSRLVAAVERAWKVTMPDPPTPTDFVVMAPGGMATVVCGGYRFVVEQHVTSYFADPDSVAARAGEMRTQQAVRACRAWRAVSSVEETPELDEEAVYALLLKLAAELTGPDTLGVYLPRLERFFPYEETVLRAMLSERPLPALLEAKIAWAPVVSESDAELSAAMAEARRRLDEFREAFAARSVTGGGRHQPFLVKARFGEGSTSEHMWLEVSEVTSEGFVGRLRSSPVVVQGLAEGDEVAVRASDVSDWIAPMGDRRLGDFTGDVLRRRGLMS